MRARSLLAVVGALAAALAASSPASAQVGGGFSYSTGAGPQGGWVAPSPAMTGGGSGKATELEMGTLYTVAAGYGVGTGIWLDAELGIDDPGLQFILPGVFGVAAPLGVYFGDQYQPFTRGQAAAVAAGMAIGAGEGIGIASYQFVHASEADTWGFRGFSRSVFLGSTAGTAVGYAMAVTMEPSPKTSLLLGSSVVWGSAVGSMFGYGASGKDLEFGDANDSASLGGLVGYNAGLLGAAALSTVWVPTYKSLLWMWTGAGIGFAASTPVYLFYAGSDHPTKRGLIFQGTATTLGLVAGAALTFNDSRDIATNEKEPLVANRATGLQITGGGPMPVNGGMGFQVSGLLF